MPRHECKLHLTDEQYFTPRQSEILMLLANGRSIQEIAEELKISYKTVANQVHGTARPDSLAMASGVVSSKFGLFGIIELKTGTRPGSGTQLIVGLINDGVLAFDDLATDSLETILVPDEISVV